MKTVKLISSVIFFLFLECEFFAQVGINATGAAPAITSMLDVASSNKGILLPRMNTNSRNAILSPATGLMIYNNQTNEFNYFNGDSWQIMASGVNTNLWNITGTSIYNNNSGNVGIGDSSPIKAKLEVSGAVNGQVALFKSISGVSIYGGSSPSIGLNMDDGKAIDTGNALKLGLNSLGFALNYYTSKNTGVAFTSPSEILKYEDYRSLGYGHWLYLLHNTDSRLLVSDQMVSHSNGRLNLIPIGVIHFDVQGLGNGDNATKTVNNVGQTTADLFHSINYFNVDTGSGIGSGSMNLILNLNIVTKGYEDIYIVGSPNMLNYGEETHTLLARFSRSPVGTLDKIQILVGASILSNATLIFGTLMVYGTKIP